jgi:penicillin amidase
MLRRIICIITVSVILSPLPALSKGATQLPGLQHYATVFRDVDGIPHIVAKNAHDLFLLQGYVHACDRFFQMDVQRRLASGTLAELLGSGALASDVELRTIGLRRAAERSWAAASPQVRKAVEAYTEGVNLFLSPTHQLPPEYSLLELSAAAPWDPIDSMVIAKLLAFGLSFDLQDLSNTEALLTYQGTGAALGFDGTALFFEDLFRSAPFDPASTVPDAQQKLRPGGKAWHGFKQHSKKPAHSADRLQQGMLQMIRRYKNRVRHLPYFRRALEPDKHSRGSNEWAVSGKFTRSRRPLVANDPHLSLDAPSTFYQIHLKARRAGYDVIGSSFAGVPAVVIGQTRDISWGATVHPMDVTDVFGEQVVPDPKSPSGLSTLYRGELEPIIPIPVQFFANQIDGVPDNVMQVPTGGPIPEAVLIVPRRNNGPIIDLDLAAGTALSLQYTGFSGTQELETFIRWNQACNLEDFIEGLQFFDVGSQNWIYADVRGNIAYFTSAEMPIREDLQAGNPFNPLPPYFIRNGMGGNEWLPVVNPQPWQTLSYEILPFEEMPQTVNPPAGYIVNANNDPIGNSLDNNPLNEMRPGGGIYYLNPGYAIGTRAGRIKQALEARLREGPVDIQDMQEIQADVVMLDAQVFTPYILQAFDNANAVGADSMLAAVGSDPGIAEAVGRLKDWDFSTPTGIPEGYDASDVDGIPAPPTTEEIEASVAATIYSVWRGQFINNTIDATLKGIEALLPPGASMPKPDSDRTMIALRNLLDNFDTSEGVGASGIDFFDVPGIPDPYDRRDILILVSLGDALTLLAGDEFEPAFGNSIKQENYRWGKLHRIVFDHPLGEPFSIPPAGGAFPPPLIALEGIPTDGGFGVVDASSHSARADNYKDFTYGSGPARRYVGQPRRGRNYIKAETILPGGSSGVLGSPFYVNLLGRWLTNDTYPVRQRFIDIFRALDQVEVYKPKRKNR